MATEILEIEGETFEVHRSYRGASEIVELRKVEKKGEKNKKD